MKNSEKVLAPSKNSFQYSEGEFVLSDADFEQISNKVYRMTGIVIQPHKRQMMYSRLVRRLRALNKKSFKEYLNYIESPAGRQEHDSFVNAVTTNITGFFREEHHFKHLEQQIEIIPISNTKPMLIWSAGCSSGEEPYSIAMSIHEKLSNRGGVYSILATDLDTVVLNKARRGHYNIEPDNIEKIDSKYISKNNNKIIINDIIKKEIQFKRLNLFEKLPFNSKFDFIFCRNVLIYFDVAHKIRVIDKLVDRLKVGGFLYLGHSESLFEEVPSLRSRGKTIYEKVNG